ncbi:uncharacterized protein LOC142327074 isoform X2 [Lycorma delicatula]|uniref:uncharacterized protein LOC142327074 isoform X2 n=1 Tax=Lycorma delicatula TaxID=130591 RepID=UPI003F513DB8
MIVWTLIKHVKTHSEQREHCCHICGERPYECSECEQKFTRSSQLQHHVKTVHRKEQRFKCDLCGKGFMYSNNFKAHMMRHEGQRNAKCNLCDKTFVTNNALFRHQRRHTGDKPFACQECGKRFADCSNRKKHMLTYHCGVKLNDTLVKKSDEIIRKEHKVIATTEDVPQNISEGQINKQNNTVTLIKSVIEPSIVLLTTLNMKNNEIIETKTLENFVNNSDISYKSSDVYVDLSNVQVISQSDGISTVDQTQLSLMPANGSLQDQELLKISNIYVNNTTSGLDVTDQFQVPESVQDNERLDIPFPDDLPIFSSLSDTLPQNMAYFIPDKELFNHADGLTQNNIQAENVTFNQIDIESNYLDLVDNQQKTTPDILNAIVPCEAQSVMKMLSSEGTVLLFPEQDDFSKITEL